MSRKPKSKRRPVTEVIATMARENVSGWITERNELAVKLQAATATLQAMQAANMPEEHVNAVRVLLQEGGLARLSYLENNVRRAAMIITRAAGYSQWRSIVENNLDMFPTVEQIAHNKALAETFGTSK